MWGGKNVGLSFGYYQASLAFISEFAALGL